jgi:Astacin (Peptidase family M12A)
MGHSLGLLHEQQRNDASSYIIINDQNMIAGATSAFAPEGVYGVDVGPFDFSSIMLYGSYAFSANGQPTMTRFDGTTWGPNTTLSAEDISTLDSLYPVQPGQAQVPRQLAATAVSANQIQITWADTNAGQATYTVERAAAGEAFQPLATLPAGSTSFVDDQVDGGTLYEYMIVANTAANVPAVSQIVADATAATPTNPAASISAGTVTLSWTDQTGGTAGYVIEYSYRGGPFYPLFPDSYSTSYALPADITAVLPYNEVAFRVHAQFGLDSTTTPLWVSGDSNTVTLGQSTGDGGGGTTGGGGGGTTGDGGGGEVTEPEVLGVVEIQHTKKKVSSVTIAFSQAMDAGSVSNPALYSVLGGMGKGRRMVYSKRLKLRTVSYNASAHTVAISLAKPFKGRVRVSVEGIIEALDGAESTSAFSEIAQ